MIAFNRMLMAFALTAMTLALLIPAVAEGSSWDDVSVTFETGVTARTSAGAGYHSQEGMMVPVPTGENVTVWLNVTNRGKGIDIDTINTLWKGAVSVVETTGLSRGETGGAGDWTLEANGTRLVLRAVTDNRSLDADDALDRWEALYLSFIITTPREPRMLEVSLSVRDEADTSRPGSRSYGFPLLVLGPGDSVHTAVMLSGRCNLIVSEGSGNSFGQDGRNGWVTGIPGSFAYTNQALTTYFFFGIPAETAVELSYVVSNTMSTGQDPSGTKMAEYKVVANTYSVVSFDRYRGRTLVVMDRDTVFRAQETLETSGGDRVDEHIYVSDPVHGYYIDDNDDDNDGFTDKQEVKEGTDPLDPKDTPSIEVQTADEQRGGGSVILFAIVLAIALSSVLIFFWLTRYTSHY